MSASTLTSTLTTFALAPSHGQLSTKVSLEAMDVNRDGQHPSSGDQPQHNDYMDTRSDTTDKMKGEVKIPGLFSGNDEATIQQPLHPEVLERPREENDNGNTKEAQSQLGKALSLITLPQLQRLG